MQLTLVVVILTALTSLVLEERSRAAAVSFGLVVIANFVIHTGPHWLVFSSLASLLGGVLSHLSRDPASSIQAMLAAGLLGWLAAMALRGLFSDAPRGDWDPDQPRRLRRAR